MISKVDFEKIRQENLQDEKKMKQFLEEKKEISKLDFTDWIINVWNYSNFKDLKIIRCCLINVELIEEKWQKDKWINCNFLINVLLKNDNFFYDFGSISSTAKD